MKLNLKTLGLAATLGLAGCQPSGEGRLVGYVVDAVSGEPVNLFKANGDKANVGDDANAKSQVYAVIDGQFRRARPCGSGDLNGENAIQADGCFQLEGIPAGVSFPIVAQLEGYARFQTTYNAPLLNYEDGQTRFQDVGNIRVFPSGYTVDYRIHANFEGTAIANAEIACQYLPNEGNDVSALGNFLQPENTISKITRAVTDANGTAVIPGAELVLGARYLCLSTVTQPGTGRILAGATTLDAGLSQTDRYMWMNADDAADEAPFVVRSNVDAATTPVGVDGGLVMTLNRPVEFAPGTVDCQQASVGSSDSNANGSTGTVVADVPGNNESEQVSASLSPDGLTLTLKARAFATPLDPGDVGVYLQFNGIAIRARDGGQQGEVRYLGYPTCAAIFSAPNYGALRSAATGMQNSAVLLY